MTLRMSDAGVSFLKKEEGLVLTPYLCQAAKWTIGYGHLMSPAERASMPRITEAEAEAMLRADLRRFEICVARAAKVPVTAGQFDAMVSLAFNIGEGSFRASTLVILVNRGDLVGARQQFARWVYGGDPPKVLPVLVARRRREVAQLWDRVDPPPPAAA